MESGSSVIIDTCADDSVLLQTIKNIVTQNQNDLENEDEFFLVQDEQHKDTHDIINEKLETASNQNDDFKESIIPSDLCRICANADECLIPIFEGEGMEHALCNKIHKYLPIRISESDSLPLQLCYHCAATLLAWHDLSEGCLNAEQRLLNIQNSLQNKEQYFHSLQSEDNDIPLQTTISSQSTPNSFSHTNKAFDVKNEESPMNDSHRSSSIQTSFKMFLEMQRVHWKPYKKKCQLQQKKSVLGGNSDTIWSSVMDTSLDRSSMISDLKQHNNIKCDKYKQHNIKIFKEEQNIYLETSASNISNKSGNQNLPYNACLDNLKKQDFKNSYRNIQKYKEFSSSTQDSYQCIECGKCFKLKDSYLRHMRIHKDERPFTCHICGKQFRDSGGLSRHLKDVHAKLKNFTCDICGNSFASKATRDDHRRTHTGERPYICDSCGKTFKSKASLYIHNKLHTNDFPHPCSYCNKKFRRRQEMLAHITTHTGEKNYGCDVCLKRFRVKSELVRHKLIHSESKPFVCVKCGLAFRQRRYLNNHVKSKHIESLRT